MSKFFFVLIILLSCNNDFSDKIVETKKETTNCLIGAWESVETGKNGEKEILKFNAKENENGTIDFYNTALSFEIIDKEGKLIDQKNGSYNWQVKDVGHIEATHGAWEIKIVLTNCSRLVLNGDAVFKKIKKQNYLPKEDINNDIIKNPSEQSTTSTSKNLNIDVIAIIGTPKRVGSIEVAENDFSKSMNLDEAKTACTLLGNGWRLPTLNEITEIYLNRAKFNGFKLSHYWCDTLIVNDLYGLLDFSHGMEGSKLKNGRCFVRAVRSIEKK